MAKYKLFPLTCFFSRHLPASLWKAYMFRQFFASHFGDNSAAASTAFPSESSDRWRDDGSTKNRIFVYNK